MTTDHEGKVSVHINRSGLWLVRLVVMQRCAANCNEADWESFWGLQFRRQMKNEFRALGTRGCWRTKW